MLIKGSGKYMCENVILCRSELFYGIESMLFQAFAFLRLRFYYFQLACASSHYRHL